MRPGWVVAILSLVAVGVANTVISLWVTETWRLGVQIVSGDAPVSDAFEPIGEKATGFDNGADKYTDVTFYYCCRSRLSLDQTSRALGVLETFRFRTPGVLDGPRTWRFGKGQFQQVSLKPGASAVFTNHTTIVYDADQNERLDVDNLFVALQGVDSLPNLQVLANTGERTAWNLSVFVC